jgi:phosphonate degradation associated HDIG domain protein
MDRLAEIAEILTAHGSARYGRESVSQLEHALQCAQLAESDGADGALVAAALLHDLGHLISPYAEEDRGVDDVHQFLAIPVLRGVVPEATIEPIRLHVEAKRYLCFAEPGYWGSLSEASKASLELQGGPFGHDGAERFLALPFAADAIRLRRWDDRAKTPGLATPPLAHYIGRLAALASNAP